MALIGAEVQKTQNYWEGVPKNPRTEFLEEKVGEGEEEPGGGQEGLRFCLWERNFASKEEILSLEWRFLPLVRRSCFWGGNFASGEILLLGREFCLWGDFSFWGGDFFCFLPKTHLSQKEENPRWLQQRDEGVKPLPRA